MKKILVFIILLLSGGAYYYALGDVPSEDLLVPDNGDELQVHFIDVGQGDSIFVELPDDKSMLIDGGEREYGNIIDNYISNLGYTSIDYLVATHPHTDHIGGLIEIVEVFSIGNIYMPKMSYNTKTYEELLTTISENNYKIIEGKTGVIIYEDESLKIEIISPSKDYGDANNNSVVIKLIYGENSFLFMGDVEEVVEKTLNEDVDVIKVGHHGSPTSSSLDFINSVSAEYAFITVGENNYNHPNSDVIKNWEDSGSLVYRTDLCGNMVISSNGSELNFGGC